jgi:lipopolysaccharide transport system ATP-binding protein
MSTPVIKAENLGKRYIIGHQRSKDDGFRHILEDVMRAPLDWLRSRPKPQKRQREDFWALRNVSFEIKQGEVVGIVGRNGAGKSTLLKVLSRITEPTEGRIDIEGRIASLLEVGTGFHAELTGRENIFLNGAILGMTRAEIKRKFDEIVAFSEVEKFLDTPVKYYSSGMYVRLAFAVAAHLEPEILVVDEVLAVGDAQFQQKCLGKMREVSQGGRTVLFVSHNMAAVQALCTRGILMEKGRLKRLGTIAEVFDDYAKSIEIKSRSEFDADPARPSITSVVLNQPELDQGNFILDIGFKSPFPLNPPVPGLQIYSVFGAPVYGSNARFHRSGFGNPKMSEGVLRLTAPDLPIVGGTYKFSVWLGDWQTDYDVKRDVMTFTFKRGQRPPNMPGEEYVGYIDSHAEWSVVEAASPA